MARFSRRLPEREAPTTAYDLKIVFRPMSDHYYHSENLPKFPEIGEFAPELAQKFFSRYAAVFEEGALSQREKSLIDLAVAPAVQCPYCIDAYTEDCLEIGSDPEQMTEAIHVAVAIRGGASLVHGIQMKNHLKWLGM